MFYLLNAEFAGGTSFAGPVINAIFFESAGMIVLYLILFGGIYSM